MASKAPAPGGEIISETGGAIISEQRGGFVGICSNSQNMANAAGDTARGELASAICVERFNAAPDSAAKLAEFKAIPDSFKKRQFVEAGGWATMPGQTTPDRLGVQGCVTVLSA